MVKLDDNVLKGTKMKHEKINIRGILIDNVSLSEATETVKEFIDNAASPKAVFTPNAEIVQACIESEETATVINSADLIIPDGAGVVLASKILSRPLKGKVPGVDLGEEIIKLAVEHGYSVYFLGAKSGIGELAAKKLKEKYGDFKLAGSHDGYFDQQGEENEKLVEEINALAPDVLYVCLGAPRQEKWIYKNKEKLRNVKVLIGLGGSLDVYAGTANRAPDIFIKLGLEWFYRLIKEPYRLGRMMKLPKFVFGTIVYKFTPKGK